MNGFSILMVIFSAIFIVISIAPSQERFMALAQYALIFAVLVEVGCMHETLKEK